MSARKEKHIRLPPNLDADFVRMANIFGLKQWEAAEIAIKEWVQRNRDEAQKRLDMFAERGVVINQPETVNIAVFQKAEVMVAKEELQRLLDVLESVKDPEYKRETQLELAKALRMLKPVCTRTRDPELLELLAQIEKQLG
jgi:hypothetical protein